MKGVISPNLRAFIDELYRLLNGVKMEELPSNELAKLLAFMRTYKFTEEEWRDLVCFDEKHYTRNLVDGGNGNFNLILLGWNPSQCRY